MEPFHLERFFAAHEFTTPHLLAVSDCESTTVSELLALEPDAAAGLGSLRLGYTESAGHAELRAAVASHHPGLTAADVLVHSAGVEVLFTACHALVEPGDEVVVQTPCYQALRTAPELAGGRVLPWQAHMRTGRWEWRDEELDELLSRREVRLLVVNTPHNPTGRHFDASTLQAILHRAREAGVRVLVDEAYAGTELDGAPRPTAAELDPTAATLGLVSKGMGLPGLRIGWLLSRDHELLGRAARVKDHTTICAAAPAEYLATLALRHRGPLLARTREILETNRALLASFMGRHRRLFTEAPPEAGSICFPRMAPGAPVTATELCARARDEAGVLLAPGVLFGAAPPDRVGPPVADAVRVGFGRASFSQALEAFESWLSRALVALLLAILTPAGVAAQEAVVRGEVVDAGTRSAISGATVQVTDPDGEALGSALSGPDGTFVIRGLPPGQVTVRATFLGYAPAVVADVAVQPSRSSFVLLEMREQAVEVEGITVGGDAFRVPDAAPVSAALLSAAEVQRTPGGQLDISRTLLSLPGVIGGVDNRNDLLVRGGGPGENAYFLDGIRIPRINHFATQGAGGGALGLVNVDFIRETEFYTGGFPVKYGEALSSILLIRNRPGSSEGVRGDVTLGASEAAVTLDGPIGDDAERGNWLFSIRRSYLQFLFEALDIPIRPDYWDTQTRIELTPTEKDRIVVVGLGALDEFDLAPPGPDGDFEDQEIVQRVIDNDQKAYTIGASWRRLVEGGFITLSASRSWSEFRFADPDRSGEPLLANTSTEASIPLRLEGEHRLSAALDAGWGVGASRESIGADVFQRATPATPFDTDLEYRDDLGWWRSFAYGQLTARTGGDAVTATLGLRVDHSGALDDGTAVSPRLSARWRFAPEWSLSGAVGLVHQTPPPVTLAVREDGRRVNSELRPIRVRQLVAGAAWQPSDGVRFSLEGFRKDYSRYPVSRDDPRISLANLGGDFGFVGAEPLLPVGEGRTRGLEFSVQKKLTGRIYALGAYTLAESEFAGADGVLRPSAWDVRHTLDLTGGYRIGERWEVGSRLRVLSGRPFTPFDASASAEEYALSGRGVPDFDRIGEVRTGAYARWDIRAERRIYFSGWNAVIYLDVQNVLDRENGIGFIYTEDPAFSDNLRPLDGTGRLPFFGFSVEF